jgi:hypothetical protein
VGYFAQGDAIAAGAQAYWLGRGSMPAPDQKDALAALKGIVGPVVRSTGNYKMRDDNAETSSSPLGRLIAIAFDATSAEMDDTLDEACESPFDVGPLERFREHFGL